MKKIDLYIFKKFIGTFFFAITMLILIVIIFDLSENIDSFLKNNAPWQRVVVDYYLMSVPYYINLFIHLFAFIAVVYFTSKMAARSEIIAILSSGVSFWRFLYPYLWAALTISVMSLYFGNFLIPKTNEIRRKFKDEYMERLSESAGRNVHVQIGKDEFVYVESFNITKQYGYKFSWEKYDGNELKYKAMSDVIYHDTVADNSWRIDPYAIRSIEGEEEQLRQGRNLDTILNLYPKDLYKMKEDFEEMDFFELRDHIQGMREKGSEGVKEYEVEMHRRMAAPAAIIIEPQGAWWHWSAPRHWHHHRLRLHPLHANFQVVCYFWRPVTLHGRMDSQFHLCGIGRLPLGQGAKIRCCQSVCCIFPTKNWVFFADFCLI